jgi:hypothetical protein
VHPERLAAACSLLINTGDLTPQGARVLQKINNEEIDPEVTGAGSD